MRNIPASDIQTRDDVLALIPESDIVFHNGLRILVKRITVAMGGDCCIEGVCQSWSSEHKYNLYMGDLVFWGPNGIAPNLMDYLHGKFLGKRL